MANGFPSAGDTTEKTISFTEIGEGLYAFHAQATRTPASSSAMRA